MRKYQNEFLEIKTQASEKRVFPDYEQLESINIDNNLHERLKEFWDSLTIYEQLKIFSVGLKRSFNFLSETMSKMAKTYENAKKHTDNFMERKLVERMYFHQGKVPGTNGKVRATQLFCKGARYAEDAKYFYFIEPQKVKDKEKKKLTFEDILEDEEKVENQIMKYDKDQNVDKKLSYLYKLIKNDFRKADLEHVENGVLLGDFSSDKIFGAFFYMNCRKLCLRESKIIPMGRYDDYINYAQNQFNNLIGKIGTTNLLTDLWNCNLSITMFSSLFENNVIMAFIKSNLFLGKTLSICSDSKQEEENEFEIEEVECEKKEYFSEPGQKKKSVFHVEADKPNNRIVYKKKLLSITLDFPVNTKTGRVDVEYGDKKMEESFKQFKKLKEKMMTKSMSIDDDGDVEHGDENLEKKFSQPVDLNYENEVYLSFRKPNLRGNIKKRRKDRRLILRDHILEDYDTEELFDLDNNFDYTYQGYFGKLKQLRISNRNNIVIPYQKFNFTTNQADKSTQVVRQEEYKEKLIEEKFGKTLPLNFFYSSKPSTEAKNQDPKPHKENIDSSSSFFSSKKTPEKNLNESENNHYIKTSISLASLKETQKSENIIEKKKKRKRKRKRRRKRKKANRKTKSENETQSSFGSLITNPVSTVSCSINSASFFSNEIKLVSSRNIVGKDNTKDRIKER